MRSLEHTAVDLGSKHVQERLDFNRVKDTRAHALERECLGIKRAHVDREHGVLGVCCHHDDAAGAIGCHSPDGVVEWVFIPGAVEQDVDLVLEAFFGNRVAYGGVRRQLDGHDVRGWCRLCEGGVGAKYARASFVAELCCCGTDATASTCSDGCICKYRVEGDGKENSTDR